MNSRVRRWWRVSAVVLGMLNTCMAAAAAADPVPGTIVLGQGQTYLLNAVAQSSAKLVQPTSPQVTVLPSADPVAPGLLVTIEPGDDAYPGVNVLPDGARLWDISAFGHIEARIVNTGVKPISVSLEPWNEGDWQKNPFNCESISLEPGAAGAVSVIFGYSYGHQRGYALEAAAVNRVMLFAGKSEDVQSFRIESIIAGGPAGEKPAVDPASVRIKPRDGILLGARAISEPANQIEAKGARALMAADGLRVAFPASQEQQFVAIKPAAGRWDLRDACEVRARLRNDGQTPVTPRLQLITDRGATSVVGTAAPLPPGASADVVIPFAAAVIWKGVPNSGDRTNHEGQPGTGTSFSSDAVAAINLSAEHEGDASLIIESIAAEAPVASLPDWLGKRPPVAGEWTVTLDENFQGNTLSDRLWTPRLCWNGPSDAAVYSQRNVFVEDGYLKIKSERKRSHEYDDPSLGERDYTTGAVTSLGKFTQRYGYIEARMKSPTAKGLWPTFWLMPDRGEAAGDVWTRRATDNGGMEVDIWEHLTSFGPYHYNIACHWDGYGAGHKQTGFWLNYHRLDAEGFIVAGLLWEPGKLTWFANGDPVATWECDRISSVPEYLKFTTQMGGWAGNQFDDAQLPDYFIIDYVRVWQRKDMAPAAK